MKLFELFQAPFKYEESMDHGDFVYTFKTDAGQEIYVELEPYDRVGVYVCSFANKVDGRKNWDLSGKGEALRIFSTIMHILEKETKSKGIKYLAFSADKKEPSRIMLYKKLVDRYASQMGFIEVRKDNIDRLKNKELEGWLDTRKQYYTSSSYTMLADKKELV